MCVELERLNALSDKVVWFVGPFNVHPKQLLVCGSWNDFLLQTTPFGIDETRETHTHTKKGDGECCTG
jgi:hypothetical protein